MTFMKTPYVSVLYEEFKPQTYKGISVQIGDDVVVFVSKEGFIQDLKDVENFIFGQLGHENYLHASSLDDYMQDCKTLPAKFVN